MATLATTASQSSRMVASTAALNSTARQAYAAVLATLVLILSWLAIPVPYAPLLWATFLIAGTVALYLAVHSPYWIALAFIAFSMFRIPEVFPVLLPLHLPLLLGALTATSLLINLSSHAFTPFQTAPLRLLSLFFFVSTIGLVYAYNPKASLAIWASSFWKVTVMTFALAWLVQARSHFRIAARTIVISGGLVAIVAIRNKFAGIGLVEGTRVTVGRDIGSVLGDPNDLAFVLLVPLSFALGLLISGSRRRFDTLLGILFSPLVLTAIVFTQSRGGLLGVLAVASVLATRFLRSKIFLCFLCVGLALGLYSLMQIRERQSGGAIETGIDQSALGRLEQWEAALTMTASRPLLGVGLGNFERVSLAETGRWKAVHSTWLGVLAETGLLGFLAFVGMVGTTAAALVKSLRTIEADPRHQDLRSSALSLACSLAGLCAAGSFLTHGYSWPIYVVVALSAALTKLLLEQEQLERL